MIWCHLHLNIQDMSQYNEDIIVEIRQSYDTFIDQDFLYF